MEFWAAGWCHPCSCAHHLYGRADSDPKEGRRAQRKSRSQITYRQEVGWSGCPIGDGPRGAGASCLGRRLVGGLRDPLFARWMGVSELVIGLTVVAGGTSLPELATSLMAAIRGERDLAIGNVVGSCILNLLMVLGTASLVAPNGIELNPALLSFDIPVMIAVSVACLPILFTDHLVARWEGALFLLYYVAYTGYLILRASHHDALPIFSGIMWAFVIPLTVITLAVLTMRAWKKQRSSSI